MTCKTCNGENQVKVGWSSAHQRKYGVKIEYDPCPTCTPPPHTYWAKIIAEQMAKIQTRAAT